MIQQLTICVRLATGSQVRARSEVLLDQDWSENKKSNSLIHRGIYFAKYYGGGGGERMAAGEKK